MKCEKIQLYQDREDVTLSTYILDDSVEIRNGRKRGAVLICPGGGYLYCSDREGEPVAMAFAAMGYSAFVLRYSVYNENKGANTDDNIIPDLSVPWADKNCRHPQPMRDVAKAMLYITEHAGEWLIDQEKVALCGFSAGAHNAAMYSVYYNKPVITEYLGMREGIKPAAVILGYMLSDYGELIANNSEENVVYSCSMKAFTGGAAQVDEAMADELSPNRQVNENTPPMFLWATAKDQLVDPVNTICMAEALSRHHIPYELHIFEDGGHGMSLGTQATASGSSHIDVNVEKWIDLADKWLKKRMAFELDESKVGF